MKKILSKIVFSLMVLSFLIPTAITFAQDVQGSGKPGPDVEGSGKPETTTVTKPIGKLQNPLNAKDIKGVILLVVDIMIYLGISFAILAIIWVGFKFVLAQGNPEKIKEARTWFFYIIIGLAILISARVIVEVVQNTLIKSGVVNQNAWTR